jgi:hypothetical protein
MPSELKEMCTWLTECGVTHVAMESTGIYSNPVFHARMEFGGYTVIKCNAAHVDGERRGMVLAEMARRVLRKKIPDLSMALAGRFNDNHALMCKLQLRHIDELTELTDTVEQRIEVMLVPFRSSVSE